MLPSGIVILGAMLTIIQPLHSCVISTMEFKTTMTISYTLPKVYAEGKISIFNIKGERVKTISINSKMSNVLWDGTDEHKKTVASGIYFYRLVTDTNISKTHKMLMLK